MPWRAVPGLCFLLAAAPTSVLATTFSLPIPELSGSFTPTLVNLTSPVQFQSISDVTLKITAQGTPEIFERCSPGTECTRFEFGPSLLAQFDREDSLPVRIIFGASENFGSEPTTLSFPIADTRGSFNFFLDGVAQLWVAYSSVSFLPEDPVRLVEPPSLQISDAQLSVTGVPVPEPGTAATVLIGLMLLIARVRRLTRRCS